MSAGVVPSPMTHDIPTADPVICPEDVDVSTTLRTLARRRVGTLSHLAVAGIAWLLTACSSTPVAPPDLPATPSAFEESDSKWVRVEPAEAQPRGEWWKAFSDPVLDDLEARTVTGNNDIRIATARVAQARALVQGVDAGRSLQANLNTNVNRQGGPLINAAGGGGTLVTLSASLSYELDLIGRLGNASKAATLDAEAREAAMQSVHLVVQTDVAKNYLALRALDAQRAILVDAVTAQREAFRLVEHRFVSGYIAAPEVARVREQLAKAESDVILLDERRAVVRHALAVLVGEMASGFRIPEAVRAPALPRVPPGIPSTVLARRPDIAEAQRTVLAARARLRVAEVAWFPNVSLTAIGGQASSDVSELFRMSARAWGIGALLALPVLDGGRRKAGIAGANAELDASIATYRERVLTAFRDVEDQLTSLRSLADRADAASRTLASAQEISRLAESRFHNGLASRFDVLDATRSELGARQQVAEIEAAQRTATVGLIRALGGGWEGVSKVNAREEGEQPAGQVRSERAPTVAVAGARG